MGRTALRLAHASLLSLLAIPVLGFVWSPLISLGVLAWLGTSVAALVVGTAATRDPEERAAGRKALIRTGISLAIVAALVGLFLYAVSQIEFTF